MTMTDDLSPEAREMLKWLAAQTGDGLGTHYALAFCVLCGGGFLRVPLGSDMVLHIFEQHAGSALAAELRGDLLCSVCGLAAGPGPGYPFSLEEPEAYRRVQREHIRVYHPENLHRLAR